MNSVTISGIIRYLLQNKSKVILVFVLTILLSLVVAYIQLPVAKVANLNDSALLKKSLNDQYKNMLEKKEGVEDRFPQLQFEELWRRYYKFYLSPKDPLRTEKLTELYSDLGLDPESIRSEFSKLSGFELNDYQLSQLVVVTLNPDLNSIEVRAYGSNPQSSDYLGQEFYKLLKKRHESISLEHELIEVASNSLIASKESFLDNAKEVFDVIEKKKKDLLFNDPLSNMASAQVSKKSQFIKFGLLGFIAGGILNLLLAVFGSSNQVRYKNMKELVQIGIPLVGAYSISEKSIPTIQQRLFSTSGIKSQKEIFEKAVFSMIPVLRESDRPLLFLYDEQVPIDQWREMFQHYGVNVSYVCLNHKQELFNAIRQNAVALVAVKEDNFVDFVQESLPLLHPSSSICVAL